VSIVRPIRGADTDELIEWHEHPMLTKIDEWAEENLSRDGKKSYYNIYEGCKCLADMKMSIEEWIRTRREMLDTLEKMAKDLPDETYGDYWLVEEG